jgi:mono/diheme cytochrome c family protein
MTRWLTIPLLSGVLATAGCSDWGDPDDDDAGPTMPPSETVSFAGDVQPIFDGSCVACHGPSGNAGLDLRPGVSHGNLVGVQAAQSPLARVEPGDPAASWLHLKLTGQQDVGTAMPPGDPLAGDRLDLIRTWIDEGAANN